MPDSDIMIKQMCREDCPQVYAIESICFPNTSWRYEDFESALSAPEQYYFVAKIKDKIAGFGVLYAMVDCGDLVNIAVHPEWRRRGVADLLLQTLLSEAIDQGLKYITLEVRMSNRAAICLYEKQGFQNISIRKQYYKNPVEDAYIMQKMLSSAM